MADEAPDGIPASEDKRTGRIWIVPVLASGGVTIVGTSYTVAQYDEVLIRLRQVKIPIPVLPLLLTDYHLVFVILTLAVAGKWSWEAFRRRGQRRTIDVNMAGVVVLLTLWALHSMVFYASIATLIQRSVPRNP